IIRSARVVMMTATPKVNVAGIVSALPSRAEASVIPINQARSARRQSWGSWRIAAAITVLAGGIGSYAVLKPGSPVRTIDSTGIVASTESKTGLGLTGA